MDWQEERDKFWQDFELYDSDNMPTSREWVTVYKVEIDQTVLRTSYPIKFKSYMYNPFVIYLEVHNDGLTELGSSTTWFGMKLADMAQEIRQEIYEYLTEWEICEWQRIGPEDRELFATDKLTAEG